MLSRIVGGHQGVPAKLAHYWPTKMVLFVNGAWLGCSWLVVSNQWLRIKLPLGSETSIFKGLTSTQTTLYV
jgi:hypothetical protein